MDELANRYKLGRRTIKFGFGMLVGLIRGEELRVDLIDYPAHLQIDVKQGYRGMGVCLRLIEAFLEQLRQEDVQSVHLGTTSHNQAACHLHEKLGFQLLGIRPNRYWTRWLGFAVDNRSYGLKLR
jgi:ribosomal protein S18 acetylase RimI-like enzyme